MNRLDEEKSCCFYKYGKVFKSVFLVIITLIALSISVCAARDPMVIILEKPSKKIYALDEIKRRGLTTFQDIAVYNGTIFEFGKNNVKVDGKVFSITNGHGNNCNFGEAKVGEFPYLYCAPLDEEDNNIYINEITKTSSRLVRTITFDGLHGHMNAVVDEKKQRVYIFLADDVYRGNITYIVGDFNGNILSQKKLDMQLKAIQGMTLHKGLIYMVAGFTKTSEYPTKLYIFDTAGNFRTESAFVVPEVEMEGISIDPINDMLYVANIDSIYKCDPEKRISIDKATMSDLGSYTYSGKPIKPSVSMKIGNIKELKNGEDYTVSYENNVNAGTATLKVTGIGQYSGTLSKTFKILPDTIKNAKISAISKQVYTGKKIKPVPEVNIGSRKLNYKTDYKIRFTNNILPGTASIEIVGKGNYKDSILQSFSIISPTMKINIKDTLILSLNHKYSNLVKITGLVETDYVKKVEVGNKKLVSVTKKKGGLKIRTKAKTGKTYIKIILASGLTKKLRVRVQKGKIKTSKIELPSETYTLTKNKTLKLSPIITPVTSQQKPTYKSSNNAVASVDKDGFVNGKKKGKAIITVKSGSKTTKVRITVTGKKNVRKQIQ